MADASDNNMGLSQKPRLRGRPLPSDPQQRILVSLFNLIRSV